MVSERARALLIAARPFQSSRLVLTELRREIEAAFEALPPVADSLLRGGSDTPRYVGVVWEALDRLVALPLTSAGMGELRVGSIAAQVADAMRELKQSIEEEMEDGEDKMRALASLPILELGHWLMTRLQTALKTTSGPARRWCEGCVAVCTRLGERIDDLVVALDSPQDLDEVKGELEALKLGLLEANNLLHAPFLAESFPKVAALWLEKFEVAWEATMKLLSS